MTTRFTADDVRILEDALQTIYDSRGYRYGWYSAIILASRLDALKDKLTEVIREEAGYVAATA